MLGLGLVLAVTGVIVWPPVEVDPRAAPWRAGSAARARERESRASEVAVAALLLVIALSTGLPVATALERVAAHCGADIAADLLRVVTAYDRDGARPLEAGAAAPPRRQPGAAATAGASRAGVAPGPLLRTAAGAILRRESVSQEAAIGRVSVRLVLPLGLVLLPAFMGTTVLPLVLVMTQGYLAP